MPNNLFTLKSIMEDQTPRPEDIIGGGILPKGGMLTISGKQKVGKSFFVMNTAVALILGRPFADYEVKQRCRVLIFSAEGGYHSNRDRIRKIAQKVPPELMENLIICFDTRLKVDDDEEYGTMKSIITKHAPDVVVIDPLVKFHGADENSAQGMAGVMGRIRSLTEDHGVSVILTHHDGKGEGSGLRGSSAIAGEYDSYMQILSTKDGHRIEYELRHNMTPPDSLLHFDSDSLWFRTQKHDPIIEIIQKSAPKEKKVLVESVMLKMGVSKSTAYRKVEKALEAGKIKTDSGKIIQTQTHTFSTATR